MSRPSPINPNIKSDPKPSTDGKITPAVHVQDAKNKRDTTSSDSKPVAAVPLIATTNQPTKPINAQPIGTHPVSVLKTTSPVVLTKSDTRDTNAQPSSSTTSVPNTSQKRIVRDTNDHTSTVSPSSTSAKATPETVSFKVPVQQRDTSDKIPANPIKPQQASNDADESNEKPVVAALPQRQKINPNGPTYVHPVPVSQIVKNSSSDNKNADDAQ